MLLTPDRQPGRRKVTCPGRVSRHVLLDAIATAVPADPLPILELATVAHLLRPAPWRGGQLTSLIGTRHRALALRGAGALGAVFRDVQVRTRSVGRTGRPHLEVLVPTADLGEVVSWLDARWTDVARQVDLAEPVDGRRMAAQTMWRAALLVAASYHRRSRTTVRVPERGTLSVFQDAGWALGIEVRPHIRPGGSYLVTIDRPVDCVRLLRAVGAGGYAEAWVTEHDRAD